MNNTYTLQHTVSYSEVDSFYKLRLDHIFSHFQNIADLHSKEMGTDGEVLLQKSNVFWILTKIKLKIAELPKSGETITVETWPLKAKGIRFDRDFKLSNNEKVFVMGSSEWCTLDYTTQKLRRVDSVAYPHDMPFREDRSGAGEKFDRVQMELARRGSLKKKRQTGVKTELGKYSSKYALTELLICGDCGTAYRRSVWSKNGKKKAVWRCISRMEYGTKYCPDSPTIEETVLHRAIVEAIQEVVNDNGCQFAIKNLQAHIRMYYGSSDDNCLAADELRLNQLIAEVMNRAKQSDADSEEFLALSQEIAETKKRIAAKKEQQIVAHVNEARMNEVLGTLDVLKNHPIDYDDSVTRKLVECIKVVSKNELLVIFKGGIEKTVRME